MIQRSRRGERGVIGGDLLVAASLGWRALFLETVETSETQYQIIATVQDTDDEEEKLPWTGQLAKMQDWNGEKPRQKGRIKLITVATKRRTTPSLGVPRSAYEHDRLGLYTPLVQEMAQDAAGDYDESIFGLMSAGFTTTCYDGRPFYDTQHKDAATQTGQSNKGTKALSQDSFIEYRAQMRSLRGVEKKPLKSKPDKLVVGPALEALALEIVAPVTTSNGFNKTAGMAEVVVSEELETDTEWHLLNCRRAIRPFIILMRDPLRLESQDQPDSDSVYWFDETQHSVIGEHGVGYGPWWLAFGSTGTA